MGKHRHSLLRDKTEKMGAGKYRHRQAGRWGCKGKKTKTQREKARKEKHPLDIKSTCKIILHYCGGKHLCMLGSKFPHS